MSDLSIAYCGVAPTPGELLASWNLDPILIVMLAAAVLWGGGHLRATGASKLRGRAFAFAMGTLVLAFVSPLCALSTALFSARVAHHLILISVAAPLLAYAFPRRSAPVGLAAVALLHVVLVWVWHAPAPYAAAYQDTALYWIMQTTLLGSATLLWQGLLSSRSPLVRVLFVHLAVIVQMGLLGALITFAPAPLYTPHFLTTDPFGLSPLDDQQLAGLLMWVPAILPYLGAAIAGVVTLLNRNELTEERAA